MHITMRLKEKKVKCLSHRVGFDPMGRMLHLSYKGRHEWCDGGDFLGCGIAEPASPLSRSALQGTLPFVMGQGLPAPRSGAAYFPLSSGSSTLLNSPGISSSLSPSARRTSDRRVSMLIGLLMNATTPIVITYGSLPNFG